MSDRAIRPLVLASLALLALLALVLSGCGSSSSDTSNRGLGYSTALSSPSARSLLLSAYQSTPVVAGLPKPRIEQLISCYVAKLSSAGITTVGEWFKAKAKSQTAFNACADRFVALPAGALSAPPATPVGSPEFESRLRTAVTQDLQTIGKPATSAQIKSIASCLVKRFTAQGLQTAGDTQSPARANQVDDDFGACVVQAGVI
jgi:hypothetical protein